MPIRPLVKTAGLLVAGSVLLFVGYVAGLFVEYQRDVRFRAHYQLYELIPRHKEMASGDYDLTAQLRLTEWEIGRCVRYSHFDASWEVLPMLLRGGSSASDEWNTDWRDNAIAMAAGFHRDRPDIALPPDVKQSLENFVPRDELVRASLNAYAVHQTPH